MHSRHVCRRLFAVVALTGLVVAAAVTDSPVAGAATDANRSYVSSLYGDLLERTNTSANTAGVEFWANRLETHPRLQVARSIQYATNETRKTHRPRLRHLSRPICGPERPQFPHQGLDGPALHARAADCHAGRLDRVLPPRGPDEFRLREQGVCRHLGPQPSTSVENFFVGVAARRGRATVAVLLATSRGRPPSFAFSTSHSSVAASTLRV